MRLRDSFQNALHPLERLLWLLTIATFLYALLIRGEWDWHSGPHVAALTMAFCGAVAAKLIQELRKRWHAGIFHFTNNQRAADAGFYLRQVTASYLYLGHSFASSISEFKKRRGPGGMAADSRIRLLLADPDDANSIGFLAEIHYPRLDPVSMRREQRRRILTTLEYVAHLGNLVEVRTHKERLRCWLHLIDGKTMVFGLVPSGSTGEVAPAITLEPVKNRWTLFDHLNDWVETLWKNGQARDVSQWMAQLKSELGNSSQA